MLGFSPNFQFTFRTEPVKELKIYETVAHEVLFQSNVPNRILFSRENPELEHFILHKAIEFIQAGFFDKNTMYMLNISASVVERYCDHLSRLPENFFFDVGTKSNFSNEHIISKLREIRDRIFVDGYGISNGNRHTVKKIEPYGVKFDPIMLQTTDIILQRHLKEVSQYSEMVVFKMISNIDELERIKSLGFTYAQGYVFGKPV